MEILQKAKIPDCISYEMGDHCFECDPCAYDFQRSGISLGNLSLRKYVYDDDLNLSRLELFHNSRLSCDPDCVVDEDLYPDADFNRVIPKTNAINRPPPPTYSDARASRCSAMGRLKTEQDREDEAQEKEVKLLMRQQDALERWEMDDRSKKHVGRVYCREVEGGCRGCVYHCKSLRQMSSHLEEGSHWMNRDG